MVGRSFAHARPRGCRFVEKSVLAVASNQQMAGNSRSRLWIGLGTASLALSLGLPAHAANLRWKGYDWKLTDGGMAGVADGVSANISVDANGYLHLRITKTGDTWTASEMFTVQKLGFGTYQWQLEGPIDTFDKNVVLGLFPYGPAAGIGGDGTNEIDIEFSRWGQANGVNADFTDYPNSGTTVGETSFKFSLGGSTSSTTRFTWTNQSIESSLLKGHQAIASEAELIKKWKYAPNNPGLNIPQQAMPLGMNLWCFGAPPSDGQNVEIVIRDFQFVKEGDPLPGSGVGGAGGGGAGGATTGGVGGAAVGGTGGAATGGAATGGTSSAAAGAVSGGMGSAGAASGGTVSGEPASGGTLPAATSGAAGVTSTASAGNAPTIAGNANDSTDESGSGAGCACQLAGSPRSAAGWSAFVGLTLLVLRRRRFLNHLDRG
jgi:hypothetical protein